MESVFGLVGKDFAIVVADTSAVHSILVHKTNEDKIMVLDSHKLMGASGETGDRLNLSSRLLYKCLQFSVLLFFFSGELRARLQFFDFSYPDFID